MKHTSLSPGTNIAQPIERGDREPQVAALCTKATAGGTHVLLITSRDTGRWIVPKGWPVDGLNGPASAMQEAWEEAGVREADIGTQPIGYYDYDKGLSGDESIPVTVSVYLAEVKRMKDEYPEVDERTRRWVSPDAAAKMVDEPELREILRKL